MESGFSGEQDAMVTLLESNVGYGIELFQMLSIYQLEDLTFAVNYEKYVESTANLEHQYERIFTSAREAVAFFCEEREKHRLGFDYEVI